MCQSWAMLVNISSDGVLLSVREGTMMPSTGIELLFSITCHMTFGSMSNLSVTVNYEDSDDFTGA